MARWQSTFLVCVMWCCYQTVAYPGPGLDPRLNRSRRTVHCNADLEYHHGDLCCKNCPPGTHLKSPCSTPGGHSQCEECDVGTFTALGNGLKKCLTCTSCREDQEAVHQCIPTHNTECQCKQGGFCDPDQACEICKRCARCGTDEIVVRNCTPTSNTECKKKPPHSGQASDQKAVYIPIVLVILLVVLVVVLLLVYVHRRRQKTADSGRTQADLTTSCNGTETLATSSRCWNLVEEGEESQFNIVPVNGHVSLKSCFEFFEELDVGLHNRFFRRLGLSDNVIKSKESLMYVDRVHELLHLWLEKRGREASLKDLWKALRDLNQNRTAETIVESAVKAGHFVYE
ncbi:hematopoietic death receptor isoform X2 [Periophthalmus magnuspinnatus]|uniref:hematopoietic death receptor isoform X2 n=1 Tax=Periophthalmus magnuspinnatus TaxID=409849 RepID=UPI0024362E70|nr:hematopoietic death receptor isoform X2 [Periophthalmus magnuspinnatus]